MEEKIIEVGFDVDGTLITYDDKPRYEVINLLHKFQKLGCIIIVASGGGKDYAEHWCNKLGITADKILDKYDLKKGIDIWFDDENVLIGKVNIKV